MCTGNRTEGSNPSLSATYSASLRSLLGERLVCDPEQTVGIHRAARGCPAVLGACGSCAPRYLVGVRASTNRVAGSAFLVLVRPVRIPPYRADDCTSLTTVTLTVARSAVREGEVRRWPCGARSPLKFATGSRYFKPRRWSCCPPA